MGLLVDAINRVCGQATGRKPYEFLVATVEAGREARFPLCKYKVSLPEREWSRSPEASGHTGAEPVVEYIDAAENSTRIPLGPLRSRAAMVDRLAYARTQYPHVKESKEFELLYDVRQDRPFIYLENGRAVPKYPKSAPCMLCGLVLPVTHLTIDHQRPQERGDLEAILKTLRAFGFTTEGPQGPKGRLILEHFTQGVPLRAVPPRPQRAAMPGVNMDRRYTLNDDGKALYSFITAAGALETFKTECMHGILNLRPACGPCNSRRGNPLKYPEPPEPMDLI